MKTPISFVLNGTAVEALAAPHECLLDLLRGPLGHTGTKAGCGAGECGACTVLMDGVVVNACLVLAGEANGKRITTIEGLAEGESLHPIQQAFVETGGMQCGFCTPGMILSAKALLDENKKPGEEEIRKALEGNFCRCTGYTKIIASVQAAARKMRD